MTKVLKLALLGPLQISIADEPLIGLDSGKARALLCYLVVNGRTHSRHALANLLWGELPESDARRNLRGVLLKLRKFVEPYLQISHQTVGLHPEAAVWVDTAVFQQHLGMGERKAHDWQTAVQLYRGEFLQEFYIRQAPDFDNWLQEQRSFFHNQAIVAHHAWASQLLADAAYSQGIAVARRLLTLEPTREASHRLLMVLLASDGQRTAALQQFEQCQQVLQAELRVAVSEETAVLHEQIRSGNYDQVTAITGRFGQDDKVTRPDNVTLSPGHQRLQNAVTQSPFIAGPPITKPNQFFGRERELKRLGMLLRQRPLQNAAIIGPRRSGKTSLLHYLRQANWLPQAQNYRWIFIDFQDARLGKQEALLRTLLAKMALDVPEPCHLETFLDVVSEHLNQPTVILFDEIGVALTRYPELDDAFWESLRSLATNQVDGNLGFVLSSAQPPDVLAQHQGMGSPFFNIFGYTAVLGPLSEEGARNLIATSPIKFAARDVDWILAESGRWPMPLQILCRERLLSLSEGEKGDDWREEALRQLEPLRRMTKNQ
ncbi:BTAD domain-containing putative transcriptional regulator [Candidatus Leptofilum sp.]|uniref:BTAD domain-containing putative transcriptional regulator n=1 Tax=Candidatus Leptofilum sp. TaxID=3241576 RepID=UPI003B5A124E